MESVTRRLQQLRKAQRNPAEQPPEAEVAPVANSEDARKARTRRLIQLGALTDQYLGTDKLEPEEAAHLLQQLVQLPEVLHIVHNYRKP